MYSDYDERAVNLGRYIAETKATVRNAAKKFGVSKSTVQTDVTISNGLSGKWRKHPETRIK